MQEPVAYVARNGSTRVAVRAGLVSLLAGIAILIAKFVGWAITGSSAVFADAAESIVNVIAAAMATYSVAVAARPADADHPYGHGKAESLSAAVEGALIVVAAALIAVESVGEIIAGPKLQKLELGIAISGGAGLANLALGAYLVRAGRRASSEAIVADGLHVMTDVITTVGTILALALVWWTGIALIDPIAALLVAANIVWTGARVIRRALASLLDEADFAALSRIGHELSRWKRPEWVEIHQLRSWTSGALRHSDLHLIVPRYLTIERAHEIGDELERHLADLDGGAGEAVVHLDPCTPRHCRSCGMQDCPVRSAPLVEPFAFTVESLTRRGVI